MMHQQYMPPGQNNNPPVNPLGFPPSGTQDFNCHQNANMYNSMPPNGPGPQILPPKQFDQTDMSQKLQNMNLNGAQGYSNMPPSQIPAGQLPPGASFPPSSNYAPASASQMPPSQRSPQGKPLTGAPIPQSQIPPTMPQKSPMSQQSPSLPGPNVPVAQPHGINQMTQNQATNSIEQTQNRSFGQPNQNVQPPTSMTHQQGIPEKPGPASFVATSQVPSHLPPQSSTTATPMSSRHVSTPDQSQMPPHMPPKQLTGQGPPQLGQVQGQGLQQPSQISSQGPPQQGQMPLHPGPRQGVPQHNQALQGQQSQFGQLPPQPGQVSQQISQYPPGPPQQHGGQIPGQIPPQGVPTLQPQMPQNQGFQQPPAPTLPGLPHMPPPLNQSRQFASIPSSGPGQQPGFAQPPAPPTSGAYPGIRIIKCMKKSGFCAYVDFPMKSKGILWVPVVLAQTNIVTCSLLVLYSGAEFFRLEHKDFEGMPPMPGQPHMPNQVPGQPPMQNQLHGQPPMPGHPGQPPMPGHPGQPPLPNQPGFHQNYQPQQGQYPGAQPPFPAQQPNYPGQQYPGYQQPQQAMKRLDPDQMPTPIQVMSDDQQSRGGIFVTNERGLVPPLVTTDFIVDDKGNASPRYIRSSMYNVPVSADMLKQTSMPLCLVISPMAEPIGTEPEPPLLDFAALTNSPTMGPVRCCRCKAYMCPNMKFLDSGRHFKCAFCKATTEVPMEYTQYVNSMQQYGRMPAEMALGTYEIVATKEYCRNNTLPNPPAIVFVIDVSYNSIRSGLVKVICDNISKIIENIPKDPVTGQQHTRVGFITYSSTVHFYNIKGNLAQPQMLSVGDVSDMFVPLLEGFLVKPEDSGAVLEALLQQIPIMFADNKETEIILLPAVQAGVEALKAADTSGQLLVFHTSLPTYPAPGKLINREDRKVLGTDKEKQILTPQTTAYNELGQTCSAAGVAVELFVANNAYVDTATIGQLPRLTGGQTHKYTYFTAEVDGERLVQDVIRVVSRPTAYDAVMRVRTSTGVRATEFLGHLFMSNTTDVELAAIDADKAIGVEIKHDDKLTNEEGVFIQAALLYTHRSGQRRLRVINLALNVANQLADVYRSCELDTPVWALRENTPRQVRDGLTTRCAKSLAAYRRHCASPSSAGQLVLPEAMKLLPLYTNCILRSDAVAGGPDITCDDRSCAMYRALTADVATSVVYTYPRLLPLHRLSEPLAAGAPPSSLPPLRASIDKMNEQGVYLLENGVHMLLWVGSQAPPEFVRDVFGANNAQQIDTQVAELPVLDNSLNEAARECIRDARLRRHKHMRLRIVHQYDKEESQFRRLLLEDRGIDGSPSYIEHLKQTHSDIKRLL
ncbi:Protein transport protein Sec24C [Eumeta japonica]|uniref:Protein transport protein Sec24C n=1 Tax=Eumeta variegata TaxID=151549 RepID=A0A4C1TF56_EUMVA|nr:Protein transport protein Sec24C [Eumeta japonica]